MSDLISRQAAIDAILHITNCKSVRELFEYNQAHHLTEMWSGGVNDAIDAVIGVESATDINVGTTDTISRKQAIDALKCCYCGGEDSCGEPWIYESHAIKAVEQLPTIQPEIIRCKDCKYWIPYDWMFREVWQSRNIADYPEDEIGCTLCDTAMKANDFCSRSERREVTNGN